MLTIENYQRLKGKVIGSTGYYVESIKPVGLLDMNSTKQGHLYMIELTNRKQTMLVELDRVGFGTGSELKLYELKLGQNYINLPAYQLRNMDLVINKINELLLEHWLP